MPLVRQNKKAVIRNSEDVSAWVWLGVRKLTENSSFASMRERKLVLEVCSNGLDSALNAQRAGADRIELCDFLEAGGITPLSDVISIVKERIVIPVHVLIRPRPGNFIYSKEEFKKMQKEIETSLKLKVEGIVVGILNHEGDTDIARCAELVKMVKPLSLTFHRAFDKVKNPIIALEEIIELGFDHILTSGQNENCLEGSDQISQLIKQADGRISIMPGAGITEENIGEIVKRTGANEFHFSAKVKLQNGNYISDLNRIRKIKEIAERTFYQTNA